MRRTMVSLGAMALFSLGALGSWPGFDPAGAATQAASQGGVVTLYARDDLASSVNLATGGEGGQILGGQVDLSSADLVFGVFEEDRFSVGFARNRLARIADLGQGTVPSRGLATDETLRFDVSRFHTLRVERGAFYFDDALGRRVREKSAAWVLGPMTDDGLVHVAPTLGNLYVLRVRGRLGDREDFLYKFQVIDHDPGLRVTLRWDRVSVL